MATTIVSQTTDPLFSRDKQIIVLNSDLGAVEKYRLEFILENEPFIQRVPASGNTTWYLNEVFDSLLEYYLPDRDGNLAQKANETLQDFPVTLREKYISGGSEVIVDTPETFTAIKLGTAISSSINYISLYRSRTPLRPIQTVEYSTEADVWIWFWYEKINSLGGTNLTFDATITYKDGSTDNQNLIFPYSDPNQGIVAINLSLSKHPSIANPQNVIQISGELQDDDNDLASEVFNLYYEERRPLRKQFLFANSLGAYNTFCCYGHSEQFAEVERTIFESDQVLQDVRVPQYGQELTAKQMATANTGYLTAAMQKYFSEMLKSESVYEVYEGQYIPIIIETSSVKMGQSKKGLRSISFDYMYAFDTPNFERDLP